MPTLLKKMGIPYEVLPNRSVIGVIEGAKTGKTLALRADIDALPMPEETDASPTGRKKPG